jgi:intein/homing endonuclease
MAPITTAERDERLDLIKKMPVLKRAWLAGLIEGEGSFTIARVKQNAYPRLFIEMTDRDVIEGVAELIGGTPHERKIKTVKHKQTYRISVSGVLCKAVARAVLPFMYSRRAQRISQLLEL